MTASPGGTDPICQTARLRLRRITPADAAFLVGLMNEPAYLENIGDRGVRTAADGVAYIREKFEGSYAQHGFGLYLVELRADRTPVGICGWVKRDFLPHPDIGFAYLERYWSKGFGFEAASGLIADALTRHAFSTVYGLVRPGNSRSIRLLEKLVFLAAGKVQVPAAPVESLLFQRDLRLASGGTAS